MTSTATESPEEPTVEIIDVTPEMARSWLSRNPNNRSLRHKVVDAYARDITQGSWVLNGESVKLAPDGTLLDGQHRLSAVAAAGQTVQMVVVRGVTEATMPTVDTGAKRTYSDALRVVGEENTAVLAAVTRRAFLWTRGHRLRASAMYPTALELNGFLEDNPALRESAEVASRLANKALLPASIVGLAHWLFAALDRDQATWFLARVADGDEIAADSPIAALRARVVKMRVGGGRVSESDALALVIFAWNAHRAGETRSKLQMPRGGLTPENFPEPR